MVVIIVAVVVGSNTSSIVVVAEPVKLQATETQIMIAVAVRPRLDDAKIAIPAPGHPTPQ